MAVLLFCFSNFCFMVEIDETCSSYPFNSGPDLLMNNRGNGYRPNKSSPPPIIPDYSDDNLASTSESVQASRSESVQASTSQSLEINRGIIKDIAYKLKDVFDNSPKNKRAHLKLKHGNLSQTELNQLKTYIEFNNIEVKYSKQSSNINNVEQYYLSKNLYFY